MGLPAALRAGDTWAWTESIADYKASAGWTLTYSLVPAAGGPGKITVTASASGDDYAVSVAAATTAGYAAGAYALSARVSKAGEVHTIEDLAATVTVQPDLGALTTYDSRSTAQKQLDNINAWLAGNRSPQLAETQIGDRAMKYWEPEKLMVHRDRLRAEVASEQASARLSTGLPDQRNLYVRWGQR